jgi:surface carbohydrate biosynthesis protein (TIGR04326 family)
MGKNFFNRRNLECILGPDFIQLDISRLHEEVANDIRHQHIDWIDGLNRSYGGSVNWWFNSVSSRNVYGSNLFQFSCYLVILERLWQNPETRPHVVFVESEGLFRAIKKWAAENNIFIDSFNNKSHLKILKRKLFFIPRYCHLIVTTLFRWIAAFFSKLYSKPVNYGTKPLIIVDTFLHDYCLSEDSVFKDRYFPYIHEYLSEKGYNVIVHPIIQGSLYNYFSIYRRMRKSDTHFIYREDFLSLADYLSALICPLKLIIQDIEVPLFHGFDLSSIIKEDKWNQSILSSTDAVLTYRLFLKLGHKLQPEQIIMWYENQIADKALIAGAKKSFPGIKITGAQLFLHSLNLLNVYPCQSEVDADIVPDILLETSKHQCKVVKAFTSDISCRSVAALRYNHLYDSEENYDSYSEENAGALLVLLPFNLDEAVEMLETLNEGIDAINDIPVYVKGHPDYDSEKLKRAFGHDRWPDRFNVFHGNLSEALSMSSLVISSNSSSMAEAVAKGKPVIFLGRKTSLNFNVLYGLNLEMVSDCFSVSELVETINKYTDLTLAEKEDYMETGKKIRDLFFEQVNEKNLRPFIAINNNDQPEVQIEGNMEVGI